MKTTTTTAAGGSGVLAELRATLATLSSGTDDWRLAEGNVWKVERMLLDYPHRAIRTSDARIERLRRRYVAHMERTNNVKPVDYRGRERWMPLPKEFTVSRDRSRASAS